MTAMTKSYFQSSVHENPSFAELSTLGFRCPSVIGRADGSSAGVSSACAEGLDRAPAGCPVGHEFRHVLSSRVTRRRSSELVAFLPTCGCSVIQENTHADDHQVRRENGHASLVEPGLVSFGLVEFGLVEFDERGRHDVQPDAAPRPGHKKSANRSAPSSRHAPCIPDPCSDERWRSRAILR